MENGGLMRPEFLHATVVTALLLAGTAPAAVANEAPRVGGPTKEDYIQFSACRGVVDGLLKRIVKTRREASKNGASTALASLTELETRIQAQSDDLAVLLKRVDARDGRSWQGGKSSTTYDMNLYVTEKPKQTEVSIFGYSTEKLAEYDQYCAATVARLRVAYN